MPSRRRRTSRIPKASRGADARPGSDGPGERAGRHSHAPDAVPRPRADDHPRRAGVASVRPDRPGAFPVARNAGEDPLAGVELVLIDGNNLIGALAVAAGDGGGGGRGAGTGDRTRLPPSAVIARIRGAIPGGVRVELVFDGPPRGGVVGRLATGFNVRYAGRISADEVIVDAVSRQSAEHGPASTWSILVVSDDRELREQVRLRGARSAGARWLAGRIGGAARSGAGRGGAGAGGQGTRAAVPGSRAAARSGTTIGHGRPPRRPSSSGDTSPD